jgi:hypothetical protein
MNPGPALGRGNAQLDRRNAVAKIINDLLISLALFKGIEGTAVLLEHQYSKTI